MSQLLAAWGLDLGPLVGWLNLIVRKCAHLVEYAVFGALVFRAAQRTWPARDAFPTAIVLVVLTAAVDESAQARLVSRTGALKDVLIDALGGGVGAWVTARGRLSAPLRRAWASARLRGRQLLASMAGRR